MNQRNAYLVRFYRLLDELRAVNGGMQRLATCATDAAWPRRGVVWFFEGTELRRDSGNGPRVVRVATHALKPGLSTTLRDRLHADGHGPHRGSTFRMLLGLSLREAMNRSEPHTWGRGAHAAAAARERGLNEVAEQHAEETLEAAVSLYVGQMPFLFLAVDDEPGPASRRAVIERNSIALLSNYARKPLDPPSPRWLGRRCPREKVPQAGLWNAQHVDAAYDPSFLEQLRDCVTAMREQAA